MNREKLWKFHVQQSRKKPEKSESLCIFRQFLLAPDGSYARAPQAKIDKINYE